MKKFSILGAVACAAALVLADSPVKGNMSDPLLVCGAGRAFLVAPDGHVAWNKSGCGNIHRVWKHGDWVYWSNGDLYRTDILTGKTELFYKPCPKEGLFGFEVLKNGNIVVAENGTDYITELQAGTTNAVVRFKADPRTADGKMPGEHSHYRMIRKTDAGTYLVCCSSANVVREYDAKGKLVWEQPTPRFASGHAPLAFDAIRRANGNTLISHLGAITEFTPDHKIVWQFTCADAPELKLDNLCGIWEKKNGNLVVGTYANGVEDGSRTTAFEITRAKKVVWSYAAAGKRFSMMTAFPVNGWQWPVAWVQTTPADEAKMAEIVGTKLAAAPKAPRRVLMFARAFGYCHNDALAFGNRAFAIAAEKTGAFKVDFSTDIAELGDAAKLAAYDAIVLNNCTYVSVKRYPAIEKTLTEYVKGGKGLCLIHSSVDSFYDSPVVADMNGGLFWGHPWMAGGTWRFINEQPDSPLMEPFKDMPRNFLMSDEIYQQSSPAFSRVKDNVLISVDLTHAPSAAAADGWAKRFGADRLRADRDFAVSWTRPYGAGRVFYTSFGHDRRAFVDRPRLRHMLYGLQYCLGDLALKPSNPVGDLLANYVAAGRVAGVVSVLSDADYHETYDCAGWATDYGTRNGRRMAPDTLFAVFSMSKTFLGAAMMCAIDEGKISLDDPVAKYLPEFADVKMKDGSKPARPVTIRDLTCHVSGFRGGYPLVNRDIPMREVARRLAAMPLESQPGAAFSYNTATIDAAGACLEVATGRPFYDYLKEKILDPLGMKDTTFSPNAEQLKRLVSAYTTKDTPIQPAADNCARQLVFPKEKPLCAAPGGGLFSTPQDMVRFSQMLAHHGTWKGKTLISRKTFDTIFAVKQTPPAIPNPYTCGSWLYGDWFGHEGAMRTDQRANLRTGQSRVFFIETENRAGPAFFDLKRDWHAACDKVQGTPATVFGN